MMMLRRFDTHAQGVEAIVRAVRRPPLTEMPAPPRAQERLDRLFGAGITPAEAVRRIVASVREQGDAALLRWTRELDGVELGAAGLWHGPAEMRSALDERSVAPIVPALRRAAQALESFHRRQAPAPVFEMTVPGVAVGWMPVPVSRAAIYVPGGTAPLLSTVLMGVIPARLAGVEEIVVATPPPVHPAILAAAEVAGAARVLCAGGAQAIGALAFGTESVPAVDVIAGPGNLFVQLAKREVVGVVGIDALAGPTEVVVLADGTARAAWVAADLLAQAEHAPDAAAILITDHPALADEVEHELAVQLAELPRMAVARQSIETWGAAVVCQALETEGVEMAEAIAPEHLQVVTADPLAIAGRIRRAGAVFLGAFSPEALGDYAAGSNHILPTGGTARFASAVGVHTFTRGAALVQASPEGLRALAEAVTSLARAEGLEAHARSVERRLA